MGMGFIAFINNFTHKKYCEIIRVCSIWYLFTFLGKIVLMLERIES